MSQATNDEQDETRTPASAVDGPAGTAPQAAQAAPDARERFREALERKNANPGTHPDSQAVGDSRLKGSNGKRKRQFRRKSG